MERAKAALATNPASAEPWLALHAERFADGYLRAEREILHTRVEKALRGISE